MAWRVYADLDDDQSDWKGEAWESRPDGDLMLVEQKSVRRV